MLLSVPDLVEFADAALAADYTRLRRVGQRLSKAIEVEDPEGARRFRLILNKKGVPLQASGFTEMLPVDNKSRLPLIEEQTWPDAPLFLDSAGNEQFAAFLPTRWEWQHESETRFGGFFVAQNLSLLQIINHWLLTNNKPLANNSLQPAQRGQGVNLEPSRTRSTV